MSADGLTWVVNLLSTLLIALILVWVIVSWVLSPYHPIRQALDRFVEPLLAPIRRVIPTIGMLDLSPLILVVLIELVRGILNNLLRLALR